MTTVHEHGVVEFRFFRPSASRVAVAGSFNGWRQDTLTMQPTSDGWWVATARLAPGTHRFRYVADGHWFTDFASNGVENGHGGWDSLLAVSQAPAAILDDAPKPAAHYPMP